MKIGYIRSSYYLENDEIQQINLEKEQVEKIFRDNLERSKDKREQFESMLDFAREGDIIITNDMSRVSDTLQNVMNLVNDMKAKGIVIKFLKEDLDTSTPEGIEKLKIYEEILEFNKIASDEYRKEGIIKGKNSGNYNGKKRQPLPKNWDEVYIQYIQKNISHTTAMNALNMKRTRFFDCVRKQKEKDLTKAEEFKMQHKKQVEAVEKVEELTKATESTKAVEIIETTVRTENSERINCSTCKCFINYACIINARTSTFANAKACESYI